MTGQDRAHWLRLKKSKWIIMAVKRYPWTEPGTASGFKRWICEDKTALVSLATRVFLLAIGCLLRLC